MWSLAMMFFGSSRARTALNVPRGNLRGAQFMLQQGSEVKKLADTSEQQTMHFGRGVSEISMPSGLRHRVDDCNWKSQRQVECRAFTTLNKITFAEVAPWCPQPLPSCGAFQASPSELRNQTCNFSNEQPQITGENTSSSFLRILRPLAVKHHDISFGLFRSKKVPVGTERNYCATQTQRLHKRPQSALRLTRKGAALSHPVLGTVPYTSSQDAFTPLQLFRTKYITI